MAETKEDVRQAKQLDIMYARIEVMLFNMIIIFLCATATLAFSLVTKDGIVSGHMGLMFMLLTAVLNIILFGESWKVALAKPPEKSVN